MNAHLHVSPFIDQSINQSIKQSISQSTFHYKALNHIQRFLKALFSPHPLRSGVIMRCVMFLQRPLYKQYS